MIDEFEITEAERSELIQSLDNEMLPAVNCLTCNCRVWCYQNGICESCCDLEKAEQEAAEYWREVNRTKWLTSPYNGESL